MGNLRVKICGITKPEQGRSIVQLGATALGFICVPSSPRYVTPSKIRAIVDQLPELAVDRIGVFANATLLNICETVNTGRLTGVQLHGNETLEFCQEVRAALPNVEIIKALRVKSLETLAQVSAYQGCIDTLLLDAYHPNLLGGTGQTIDWSQLQQIRFECPWLLAGGLTPDNILAALTQLQPDGIDLSSGVELAPGDKDLDRVALLFDRLEHAGFVSHRG